MANVILSEATAVAQAVPDAAFDWQNVSDDELSAQVEKRIGKYLASLMDRMVKAAALLVPFLLTVGITQNRIVRQGVGGPPLWAGNPETLLGRKTNAILRTILKFAADSAWTAAGVPGRQYLLARVVAIRDMRDGRITQAWQVERRAIPALSREESKAVTEQAVSGVFGMFEAKEVSN